MSYLFHLAKIFSDNIIRCLTNLVPCQWLDGKDDIATVAEEKRKAVRTLSDDRRCQL